MIFIIQSFSGVSQTIATSPAFATSIQTGVATALNLPVTAVSTPVISFGRLLRRVLLQTGTATVTYTVTATNILAAAIESTLSDNTATQTINSVLSDQGYSGIMAAAPTLVNMSPTMEPSSRPSGRPTGQPASQPSSKPTKLQVVLTFLPATVASIRVIPQAQNASLYVALQD